MKSIKFFFACVLALTFVACSNAESDSFEDNSSSFESMISLYGIQTATTDSKVGDVPSVTAEEMASVLEALRQNGNTVRNCESETSEGYYGTGSDRKEVKMTAEYQARTRSGAFVEQFALCVSINFNIDNNGGVQFKEDGLVEIISDYNEQYGQEFSIPTFAKMKKDIAARLAHKKPYERIANEPAKQIDLLIVVDQMLTGFDSKWINTLYMDKVLQYENIIQAFSRTNRLFGPDKPFGTIRYYRKPHTMERNINAAVKLYSGDRPLGLFVQHLIDNLKQMNELFESITDLFADSGIENFEKLPDDTSACRKFAKDFNEFNSYLEAAKIQGFKWNVLSYVDEETGEVIDVTIDENTYLILVLRYKELTGGGGGTGGDDVPYDLSGYITEIDTGLIDADYMNSKFDKYIKLLSVEGTTKEAIEQAETELHKTFATLSQEEQKYANIFLHDIQRGDVKVAEGKSLRDYINEYLSKARNDQIHRISVAIGVDENMLRNVMGLRLNENNLNEFGRYDELKKTVDKAKAKEYFEKVEGTKIIPPKVNVKVDKLLRDFIINGGYEIQMPTEDE